MGASTPTQSHDEALAALRSALLALKPTGATGFEGLLAVVLEQIAGQPFRLAKSGLQLGKDGETLISSNHLSFEAKLYKGKINDNEVLTKITRLIASPSPPDLWVLGATVEVGAQLGEPLQMAALLNGIGILVLDWPSTSPLPPLAVACALAPEECAAFLTKQVKDAALVIQAVTALRVIGQAADFERRAAAIAAEVQATSLGLASARDANAKWLQQAFSDRAQARASFGQALAPNAASSMRFRARTALSQQVRTQICAPPSRGILALIGGEGRGKTWLFAEAWLELDQRPLTILVPAVDMKSVAAYGDFVPFLISKIIQQTDDRDDEQTRRRWERRLRSWAKSDNGSQPRFILCVDGLNQQPRFEWPRWLDDAAANVELYGGSLVITVRKGFFDERLRRSLNAPVTPIIVPEWSSAELNELLEEKGIAPSKLTLAVHERLRNPRILAIAFDLLDNTQIQNFTELSVDRLLFEHIRSSARDGTPPEPPKQFVARLAGHAQEIIDRTARQETEDRLIFDHFGSAEGRYELTTDLLAVTAEHFFHPLPDEGGLYTLSEEGLSLALGLAIVGTLRKAERNSRDVLEALNVLLEPISALDKTADAVFSALMAVSVDEDCPTPVVRALFAGFLGLQNIDEGYFKPFVGVVRNTSSEAMASLEELIVSKRHVASMDWLPAALSELREHPEVWASIAARLDRWLRYFSLDPSLSVFARVQDEGREKYDEKTREEGEKLDHRRSALTVEEQTFLRDEMIERSDVDPGKLAAVAFDLLAGKPLQPFSVALVAHAFSSALHSSIRSPYAEYTALVRFNQNDWTETREDLLRHASFMRAACASSTSKWALVHILRAVSTEDDAREAERLVEELTADRERMPGWRLVEDYCASDPCDPASTPPHNIGETAKRRNGTVISRSRT